MLPKTHEEFRKSVCVGCHKPGQHRTVSENLAKLVREKIFSGYTTTKKIIN